VVGQCRYAVGEEGIVAEFTVLVVDDEPDLADLYGAWLGREYTVRTAYGGDAAIEVIDETVDLVLLDRLMPDRSGDEVLAEIRERGYECQVAMVTAVEPDFDIIGMGFDDYLVKPILRDELLTAVENLRARGTYNAKLQEFYALAAKRAALMSQKSERELADSESYTRLNEAIEQIQRELDETTEDLDERGFEMALRKIGEDD
jgi:two-component system response regulator AdeR